MEQINKPFLGKYRITQPFGVRVNYMRCGYHTGVDWALPTGTPIYSASSGRVIMSAKWQIVGYGREIRIQREDGLITQYAHLSKIFVKTGEKVEAGELIGKSGHSGYCISLHGGTGAHLHFGTMYNHRWFNPLTIINKTSLNLGDIKKEVKIDYTKRPKGTSHREWWAFLTGRKKQEYPGEKKIEVKEKKEVKNYEVQRGDTLSSIAQKEFGEAREWKKIFDDNRDIIDDPDLIRPGQVLKIIS